MKTIVCETRVPVQQLAECVLAFEHQGLHIKSKSALVAACVNALAEVLKSNGSVPSVEDDEKAQIIIDRYLKPVSFNHAALAIPSIQQMVADATKNLKQKETPDGNQSQSPEG